MLRRDRTVGDEKPVCKLKERSTRGKSIRRIKTTLEIFNIRAEEGREGEKESDRKCS